MNDSRLFMEIGVVDNNTFLAKDKSPYERWSEHLEEPHYIFQALYRVIDGEIDDSAPIDSNVIGATSMADYTSDENRAWTSEVTDGLYYYQKFIIPTETHSEGQNEYIYYDEDSEEIMYKDLDSSEERVVTSWLEAYDLIIKNRLDNCFHFDDYSFSIFALVECYVNIESDRIAEFLKNGCSTECTKSDLEDRADILLAAINVIRDLMEKGDFFEAQRILDGLSICNGLCQNYNKKLNPCGCGNS